MAKTLKLTILFISLLLPVCIFTFLKLFGTNRFDIPVYYQTEEEIENVNCEVIATPYIVNLNRLNDFENLSKNIINNNKTTIIANLSKQNINILYQIARIKERLGNDYQLIVFDDGEDNDLGEDIVHFRKNDSFQQFWECVLINNENDKWVLLDSENRIRGYYEVNEKEVDRLIVEVKILLDNQ